ncbi:hypothetical protein EDB89DRAFT_1851093 [Lactarius sanguifluus]|nr:hypothetical protein EDB89DRAFT_1851093 [Lactarius sanguifluus]
MYFLTRASPTSRHLVPLLTSLPASRLCSFVTVSLLDNQFKTPVCKRNLNPVYEPNDTTFDFPIFSSLVHKLGALMFVVWGAGMISDTYLGECSLPIDRWFRETVFAFDDPNNGSFTIDLISSHPTITVSGTIHTKLGFVHPQLDGSVQLREDLQCTNEYCFGAHRKRRSWRCHA